jgi:hypothetical protein
MKFKIFRYYFPISLVVAIIIVIAGFVFQRVLDWKLIITLVGSIISSIYFVEKQKLEQLRLFKELFAEFNKRYDGLNEKLNQILIEDQRNELTPEQINILYDYFNLCSEEYLYYKEGFIYPEVWKAWCNGIKVFGNNRRISELWREEARADSYYGFKLSVG